MQRRHRLRRSSDFRTVRREGRSVVRPEFVLYHARRDGQPRPRFGFAVGRRIGGAVVRNRAKRLLREACRPLIPRLDVDTDVVIVARGPVRTAHVVDLRRAVEDAVEEAGLIRRTEEDTSI